MEIKSKIVDLYIFFSDIDLLKLQYNLNIFTDSARSVLAYLCISSEISRSLLISALLQSFITRLLSIMNNIARYTSTAIISEYFNLSSICTLSNSNL